MSRFSVASVLLLLSLPHGFAAPSDLPTFQVLDTNSPDYAKAPSQPAQVSLLTGDVFTESDTILTLSDPVPIIAHAAPNEVPKVGSTIGEFIFIHILSQFITAIGNLFTTPPGEDAFPFPFLGNDTEFVLLEAAAEQAAIWTFPMLDYSSPLLRGNQLRRTARRRPTRLCLNSITNIPL